MPAGPTPKPTEKSDDRKTLADDFRVAVANQSGFGRQVRATAHRSLPGNRLRILLVKVRQPDYMATDFAAQGVLKLLSASGGSGR